ncbi:MAG: TIM-barrel domain-containing protein [Phycisphaerae bacterium]|jgi:alpha-glucosidase (family GH31 glycosyl hydrolase)
MKINSLLFVIITCILLTATAFADVTPQAQGENELISFEIDNDNLDEALVITPNGKNGIYYETDKGKTYLAGEPVQMQEIENGFRGEWKTEDERIVKVAIQPNGDNYEIKFTAEPNAGINKWGFALSAADDEYFTGCFERTVDGDQKLSWEKGIKAALNLRGQRVEMFVKPTVSLYCPFYISSRGYGLFTKGTWPGVYDFCKANREAVGISFEGKSLEMILYTADEPMAIVSAHSLNVGPTILPPRWAFSSWRWRDNHINQKTYYDGTDVNTPYNSQVVEDVLMMDALGIPCGVYWVDRPWAVGSYGYDDFEWDRDRLPQPEKMIKWLGKKDIKFMLWIAPWVSGDMAKTAREKGYNLKGQTANLEDRTLIDFTNPDAKKWWQNTGVKKVLNDGVAGFKLDRAEELTPSSKDFSAYDGRSTRENRNDYPRQYIEATWEICKKVRGEDFVLLPRAGYTGSSKYGCFWGGDIASPAEGLRAAIIAQQRSAIIGYPLWGSDTGGYWGGELDREVTARWLAFSCFSPIMEVGPTEDRGLWDMKNEPKYDAELIAIWRLYAQLHTRLMDYSYTCAKEARDKGVPIVRPMFLEYPEQVRSWEDWETYFYGPDILVSPVWQKGVERKSLYLPAVEQWVYVWDGKVYEGGQDVMVDAPSYKMPIFVRKGAAVMKAFEGLDNLYKESLAVASKKPNISELQKTEKF